MIWDCPHLNEARAKQHGRTRIKNPRDLPGMRIGILFRTSDRFDRQCIADRQGHSPPCQLPRPILDRNLRGARATAQDPAYDDNRCAATRQIDEYRLAARGTQGATVSLIAQSLTKYGMTMSTIPVVMSRMVFD